MVCPSNSNMRAIPNIFGDTAIMNRGNSGSEITGEDRASARTVSGVTSNPSMAEKSEMAAFGEVRAT